MFGGFDLDFGVDEKFVKLKYDGIGIQCSFKDSYIWGQNREEHLLATSDHFELTVSDFSIVKTTVVLWKQGKMTQYVRSAVSKLA